MKFNSQICTTREQSERLLALGLKKETADMHHYKWSEGYWDIQACPVRGSEPCYIPAWSLHRLIEITEVAVGISAIWVRTSSAYRYEEKDNAYDNLIDAIADLINIDVFNKEYLEGKIR